MKCSETSVMARVTRLHRKVCKRWFRKLICVSTSSTVFSLNVRLVLKLHHDCNFTLSNALISSVLHCMFLSLMVDVKINRIRLKLKWSCSRSFCSGASLAKGSTHCTVQPRWKNLRDLKPLKFRIMFQFLWSAILRDDLLVIKVVHRVLIRTTLLQQDRFRKRMSDNSPQRQFAPDDYPPFFGRLAPSL